MRPVVKSLEQTGSEAVAAAQAGELTRARELFAEGRKRAIAEGDERGAIRFLIGAANVDLITYRASSAMRAYLEALERARQLDDQQLASILLFNMSLAYDMSGSTSDAVVTADEALARFPKEGDLRSRARILAQKALLTARLGKVDEALEVFARARRDVERAGDVVLESDILEGFGLELLIRGDTERAAPFLVESFRLLRMTSHEVPDSCYRDLSALYLAEGKPATALTLMQRAFEAARRSARPVAPWTLYYRRARIHRALGDRRAALADLEAAVQSIDHLRLELLPADSVRVSSGVVLSSVYGDYVAVAGELYRETGDESYARRAFLAAERGRASALRESDDEFRSVRQRLPDQYWKTLKQVTAAERARLLGRPFPAKILAKNRHRLTELELQAGLAQGGSDEARRLASLSGLQKSLGSREALLSFHAGERDAYLWSVTRTSFGFHRIEGAARLARRITEFRGALEGRDPSAARLGEDLYATLFSRLGESVRRKPEWVLELDGSLFDLPFAALVAGHDASGPHYLIERHSVRVTPAAGFLLDAPAAAWNGGFLAVGDPIYNIADPRWRNREDSPTPALAPSWLTPTAYAAPLTLELARLAASGVEADSLCRLYSGRGAETIALTGARATKSELRRALRRHPAVLHFATHVVGLGRNRDTGYIALSLDSAGRLELLGPSEIAAREIRPKLVTLSGCESGAGATLPGEGLFGLTRAWTRAGASNVLATHFPALDSAGSLLNSFYRRLRLSSARGASMFVPEALRQAQLEMLRTRTWKSHPGYWAGYFLVSRN